jgi:hypothetical protein
MSKPSFLDSDAFEENEKIACFIKEASVMVEMVFPRRLAWDLSIGF